MRPYERPRLGPPLRSERFPQRPPNVKWVTYGWAEPPRSRCYVRRRR
jgi:hypothetical protein